MPSDKDVQMNMSRLISYCVVRVMFFLRITQHASRLWWTKTFLDDYM
jgi:hypothetical protein